MEQKRAKTGGRAKGTPNKVAHEVRSLAQQHGADAIGTLAEIMADPTRNENARIAAAREMLDRGYGKSGVEGVTALPLLMTDNRPVFEIIFLDKKPQTNVVENADIQDVKPIVYDEDE